MKVKPVYGSLYLRTNVGTDHKTKAGPAEALHNWLGKLNPEHYTIECVGAW